MNYRDIAGKIFKQGKEKLNDMEVYIENNKSIDISLFDGEIDGYSIAESGGLSLRGTTNGSMGYSYTEKVDESSISFLINEVFENAKFIDSDVKEKILQPAENYKQVDNFNKNLEEHPIEKKIEFIKSLEKEALLLDDRITSVQKTAYQEFDVGNYIINTKGTDLSNRVNGALAYISVIAKDGEDTKTGMGFRILKDFSGLDYREIAKEAVDEAIAKLGATPIKSGEYPVLIRNYTFASLLDAFSSIFSADNVQKDLSLLKGKIGKQVASGKVTLVDNPHLKYGFRSSGFDDEGSKTIYKKIIDKGTLTNYLYNSKTAKKDGKESTGNASRKSYKSSIDISGTNCYLEAGKETLQTIISEIEYGLYIMELEGLHAGLNAVSGDFSLSANGFLIVDGEICRPVNGIVVSGNFFDLLKDIDKIGNDLVYSSPFSLNFGSPTVKIKNLSVSGD